jgi:hypothetical protein
MGSDVSLVDFTVDLAQIAREEDGRIIALVEAFEVQADVDASDTVEVVVVRVDELLHQGSCVVKVAGSIDKTQVTLSFIVYACIACRVGRTTDLYKRIALRIVDGKHLLIHTGTIVTFHDGETHTTKILCVVWVTVRF